MTEAIVVSQAAEFMPVMDIRQARSRRDALIGYVKTLMVEGQDYGKIPGTDKPTLLKPGAEKLVTFFGLSPVFVSERIVEDFGDGGGEPLFFYRYRCELYRNGTLMGTGIGSCNSRESKYRYRNSERVCPTCGKPTVIKGKADFGGGWLCFAKKGGCGAKFREDDPSITSQHVGKVPNPDIADIVNTIDKMAQKRALISATLISVNASEFFTQDVEDMTMSSTEYVVVDAAPRPSAQAQRPSQAAPQPRPSVQQQSAVQSSPVVQPPSAIPVDGDNPFMDNEAPTAEELIIIDGWVSPSAAHEWITDHGLASNKFSARSAWMAAVKACGGYTAQNAAEVKLTYLRERLAKHGAPATAELANVPELAH